MKEGFSLRKKLTYVNSGCTMVLTNDKGGATMNKEIRAIIEEAERQGWRSRPMANGHTRLYGPDGRTQITLPGTPSDYRSLKNAIADMRRVGFQWPPKGRR